MGGHSISTVVSVSGLRPCGRLARRMVVSAGPGEVSSRSARARPWCILRFMAAILNLNHPAHVVHWHFFQMSVSNIVVVVLMLIVFAAAILAPFPGHARR